MLHRKLICRQVIITTYQTLNMDFSTPDDVEEDEKLEWLIENGCVNHPLGSQWR